MLRGITTLLALASAAALLALPAAAESTAPAARLKTIAVVTTVDFRAVLVAREGENGGAPTADVTLRADRRAGATWRRILSRRLAGPYFWKTVTGPRSVCRFEIATASTARTKRPRVTVQLLQSPSLGCARAQTIPLVGG